MPLDHFSLLVPQSKFEDMIKFLHNSLQHMGFKEQVRPAPSVVGMGEANPYLWVAGLDSKGGDEKIQESVMKEQHIAFTAESQFPNLPVLCPPFDPSF